MTSPAPVPALPPEQSTDWYAHYAALHRAALGTSPYVRRTTSYTLKPEDAGITQVMDSSGPLELIVPAGLPEGGYFPFVQWGTGQLTVVPTSTASAAPTVRDSIAYAGNTAATSHPIPIPAGTLQGDGLLTLIQMASTARNVTGPIDMDEVDDLIGPSGAGMYVYRKVRAASTDISATKTLALDVATPIVAVTLALAGSNATEFIDGTRPLAPDTESDASGDAYTTVAGNVLELAIKGTSSGTVAQSVQGTPSGLTFVRGAVTNRSDANSQVAVARAGGGVPAGTVIGNRAWSAGTVTTSGSTATPTLYGPARTIGIRPTVTPAHLLRSFDNAFKTAGQNAEGAVSVYLGAALVGGNLVV